MAFDQIYSFIDLLYERGMKAEEFSVERNSITMIMIEFLESVLSIRKLNSQKQYCKNKIEQLNPSFSAGYFSRPKKTKSNEKKP